MQCVTCAAHYCTYFTQKIIRKKSNKNSKDYNLYTLKNKRKRTRQIWHWLAFCKVRGKLSRAQKICVLLIMQIFPPPVMFCYCFSFWGWAIYCSLVAACCLNFNTAFSIVCVVIFTVWSCCCKGKQDDFQRESEEENFTKQTFWIIVFFSFRIFHDRQLFIHSF